MIENRSGQVEIIQFAIQSLHSEPFHALTVGNSGLSFLYQNEDWTWHFQPDGNSKKTQGKEIKYATLFLAAFGKFMMHWRDMRLPDNQKPFYIHSITNPTMADFIRDEFKHGLVPTAGNPYEITFDLSAIDADTELLHTFSLARERCSRQNYLMVKP